MNVRSRKALNTVMIVLVMLITMIAVFFSATNVNVEADTGSVTYLGTTYDTFEEAVSHWDSIKGTDGILEDKTIYLNEDITIDSFVCGLNNYHYIDPKTKEEKTNGFLHELYLDLNGHNLHLGNDAIEIIENSRMHITGQGSVITSGSNCFVVTYGSLKFENTKIDGTFDGSLFYVKYGGIYFTNSEVNLESTNNLLEKGSIFDVYSEKNKSSGLSSASHIDISNSDFNIKYNDLKNLNYEWNVINGNPCRIQANSATMRVDIADNNHSSFTSNVINNYGDINLTGSEIYVTGESSNINSTVINSSTVDEQSTKKTYLSKTIISSQFTNGENVVATGINSNDGMLEMTNNSIVLIKAGDNVCESAYCVKYNNSQDIKQSTITNTKLICDCNAKNTGTCVYSSSSTNILQLDTVYTYSQVASPVGEISKINYKSGYTNQDIDKKYRGSSTCDDLSSPVFDAMLIDSDVYSYTYTKDIVYSAAAEAKIDDRYYNTINDAFLGAEKGDTIELIKNVNMAAGVEVNTSCTLNMCGYTITLKEEEPVFDREAWKYVGGHKEPYFTVNDCTFTLTGSANFVTEDNDRIVFYANAWEANIVIDNVTLNADVDAGYEKFFGVEHAESLVLKKSTINLIQPYSRSSISSFIYCRDSEDFVMSDCTITYNPQNGGHISKEFINIFDGGDSIISDSTINISNIEWINYPIISYDFLHSNNINSCDINLSTKNDAFSDIVGIECNGHETLDADGLTMNFVSESNEIGFTGISVTSGSLNLKNSEIYLKNKGAACTCISNSSSKKSSIQESKFAALGSSNENVTCVANYSDNRIVAHKSYFHVLNSTDSSKGNYFYGDVYVTSGTYFFKSQVDAKYYNSKYYVIVADSNPTYTSVAGHRFQFRYYLAARSGLKPICSIGTTNYYDFQEAIKHAKRGQTILVNKAVTSYSDFETIDITSSTTNGTDFTIDFQGNAKTINMPSSCTNGIHVGADKTVTIKGANLTFNVNSKDADLIKVDNRATVKFTDATQIALNSYKAESGGSVVMLNNNGKVTFENGKFILNANSVTTNDSTLPSISGIKSANEKIVSGNIEISFNQAKGSCVSGIEVASDGESHLHEFVSGNIRVAILDSTANESYCIKDTGDGELVMDTTNGYFVNNVGGVIGRESGKTIIKKGYYAQYAFNQTNQAKSDMFSGSFDIAGGYFTDNTLSGHCLDDFHYILLSSAETVNFSNTIFGFTYRVAQANARNLRTEDEGFIDDLVNTARDGDTIKIIQKDAEVNCVIKIEKNLTIDIDDNSLSTFEDDAIFDIQSGKKLTLMGNDASANCYRNENGAIAMGAGELVVGKTNYYYKNNFVDDNIKTQITKEAKGATFSTDTTLLCNELLVAKKDTATNRYEIVDGPTFFTRSVVLSGALQVVHVAAMRNVDNMNNVGFRVTRDVAIDSQPVNTSTVHKLSDSLVSEVKLKEERFDEYKAYKQYQIIADDIAAKQIGDVITFQIVLLNNSGEVTHVFDTRTYSAKQYAYKMLENKNLDINLRTLLVAMLEYSSYAQKEFDWNTNDLANKQLSIEDASHYADAFNELKCDASACPEDINPVEDVGKQIDLGSTLSINFWIPEDYPGQYNEDDYTFTFKNGDYNSKFTSPGTKATFIGDVTGVREKGDLYCCVRVEGIKLQLIDTTFSLQVLDNNHSAENNYSIYKYSVANYICDELEKVNGGNLVDLLKSLYLFGLTTQEYRN